MAGWELLIQKLLNYDVHCLLRVFTVFIKRGRFYDSPLASVALTLNFLRPPGGHNAGEVMSPGDGVLLHPNNGFIPYIVFQGIMKVWDFHWCKFFF